METSVEVLERLTGVAANTQGAEVWRALLVTALQRERSYPTEKQRTSVEIMLLNLIEAAGRTNGADVWKLLFTEEYLKCRR